MSYLGAPYLEDPRRSSIQILLALIIIATNSTNCYIFSCFRNIKITHYYNIALAVADLLVSFMLLTGASLIIRGDSVSSELCQSCGMMFMLPLEITVLLHCLMSIDKCRAIINPIDYRTYTIQHSKARTRTILQLVAAFISPVIINTVFTQTGIVRLYFEPILGVCFVVWDIKSVLAFSIFSLWPMVVQLVTYGMIVSKIVKLNKFNRRRLVRTVRTVVIIIASFYICWLPNLVYIVWTIVRNSQDHPSPLAFYITGMIAVVNSCLSMPIYSYTMAEYRQLLPGFLSSRVSALKQSTAERTSVTKVATTIT